MGFRNYISFMPKEEYEQIKDFTKEELFAYKNAVSEFEDEEPYISVDDFGVELHGFGKYCDFTTEFHQPVFTNKETQDYFLVDNDFYRVNKEFLASIIEVYRLKIKTYYKELVDGITNDNIDSLPNEKVYEMFIHIRSMYHEWNPFIESVVPYNLHEGDEVTVSWKYEYVIFELVRIYKTFDWENNVMIYYGY